MFESIILGICFQVYFLIDHYYKTQSELADVMFKTV